MSGSDELRDEYRKLVDADPRTRKVCVVDFEHQPGPFDEPDLIEILERPWGWTIKELDLADHQQHLYDGHFGPPPPRENKREEREVDDNVIDLEGDE